MNRTQALLLAHALAWTASNFMYQFFTKKDYAVAIDRSFVMAFALWMMFVLRDISGGPR